MATRKSLLTRKAKKARNSKTIQKVRKLDHQSVETRSTTKVRSQMRSDRRVTAKATMDPKKKNNLRKSSHD